MYMDWRRTGLWCVCLVTLAGGTGCHFGGGPGFDPPFANGQVNDAHWETQQTNAEAADFIFFDHDFVGDGEALTPAAKKKLESVALRLPHVPFPITVEQSPNNQAPELDGRRRQVIVEQLGRLGITEDLEDRVVVAPAFVEGFTAMEGERAYTTGITTNFGTGYGQGGGRFFGGFGGIYR